MHPAHALPLLLALPALADPAVPGLTTSVYSELGADQRPFALTRGDDGAIFASSDNNANEGVFIKRIPPGGGPATNYNTNRIYDPDGVLFDATGAFSGVPGTVLVGCTDLFVPDGLIRGIRPDGTDFIVVGSRNDLNNGDAMAFDSLNRLYLNVHGNGYIARFVGLQPTVFASFPAGVAGGLIAIDDADRVWSSCNDGNLRRYSPAGVLEATIRFGDSDGGLAFCPGGPVPRGIYLTDNSRGLLLRVTQDDQLETVGTCPLTTYGIAFDAANMYLAEYLSGRLWRLASCPADFNGDGFLDFFDYDDYVNCFESGSCPPGKTADFNNDGFADFFDYDDFVAAFESGC